MYAWHQPCKAPERLDTRSDRLKRHVRHGKQSTASSAFGLVWDDSNCTFWPDQQTSLIYHVRLLLFHFPSGCHGHGLFLVSTGSVESQYLRRCAPVITDPSVADAALLDLKPSTDITQLQMTWPFTLRALPGTAPQFQIESDGGRDPISLIMHRTHQSSLVITLPGFDWRVHSGVSIPHSSLVPLFFSCYCVNVAYQVWSECLWPLWFWWLSLFRWPALAG